MHILKTHWRWNSVSRRIYGKQQEAFDRYKTIRGDASVSGKRKRKKEIRILSILVGVKNNEIMFMSTVNKIILYILHNNNNNNILIQLYESRKLVYNNKVPSRKGIKIKYVHRDKRYNDTVIILI